MGTVIWCLTINWISSLHHLGQVYWNRSTPELYEHAIRRYEGQIDTWALWWFPWTAHRRAAKDKYVVDEPKTTQDIWWER